MGQTRTLHYQISPAPTEGRWLNANIVTTLPCAQAPVASRTSRSSSGSFAENQSTPAAGLGFAVGLGSTGRRHRMAAASTFPTPRSVAPHISSAPRNPRSCKAGQCRRGQRVPRASGSLTITEPSTSSSTIWPSTANCHGRNAPLGNRIRMQLCDRRSCGICGCGCRAK